METGGWEPGASEADVSKAGASVVGASVVGAHVTGASETLETDGTGSAVAGPPPMSPSGPVTRLVSLLRHPAAGPSAVLLAGAVGAGYLYGADPHEPGHLLPRCPFRMVTGLLCPACGGTRMVYDLMHGHFTEAWLDNRALLLASPYALALLGRWAWEGLRGRRWRPTLSPRAQLVVLVAAVAWTVVRNVV